MWDDKILPPFYAALNQYVPGEVTISLEVEDTMEVQMGDLRKLATQHTFIIVSRLP